mmetsp:Transcript_38665/g.56848  ORF Transcript_38665/g.56848 Transcript_38665/m.56848 type:complete len:307 (-) Transcript_38665:62-982(-)|eukprot:CAMPEP_0179427956 /NCGR_PEP_ID=MMETSP0799-20121207/13761_1 /TAXON_ID=46947 /ORGANISM="Geminigera cryophila, Strain CCMP2564" /LENGTH=306 /DNA_ID=CAMNT_0021203235 /DNA_START=40 /DNA_END=963 /DNA_ORIENTATION=+
MPEADDAPVVGFIKKERKGNFRKKEKIKDDDDETEDVRKQILETKLEHKMRARVVGVQSDKLAANPKLKERTIVVEESEDAGASMLDNQFSAEADQDNSHVGLMEQEMLKFIDQKIKGETAQEEAPAPKTRKDELFDIPDHLKVHIKDVDKSSEEVQDNGAETWLTGIVEVELPMDEKLRNIEETEKAKKKILAERMRGVNSAAFIVDTSSEKGYSRQDQKPKKKGGRPDADKVPMDRKKAQLATGTGGNFSVNFVQRGGNREVRDAAANKAPTGMGKNDGGFKRPEMSSDDMVMERFKKRFCMKK